MNKYLVTGGLLAGNIVAGNVINVAAKAASKKLIKDGKSKKSRKRAKMLRTIVSSTATAAGTAATSAVSGGIISSCWKDHKPDIIDLTDEESKMPETSGDLAETALR